MDVLRHTYSMKPFNCVRCGGVYGSKICKKSMKTPAKCALFSCDHPTNYKGCDVYKNLKKSNARYTFEHNPETRAHPKVQQASHR